MAPIPKYYQIKTDIRQKIEEGAYVAEEPLPPEQVLQEKYNVSRITVRKALEDLCTEGLIFKIQGKGTFVKPLSQREINITEDISCLQELEQRGYHASRILLNSGIITCESLPSSRCFLDIGERYFFLERIFTGDGIPITYEKNYYLYRMVEGIEQYDFQKESVTQVLHDCYSEFSDLLSKHFFTAVMPDKQIAKLMKIDKKPLIRLDVNRFVRQNQKCVSYSRSYIRSDILPVSISY